MKNTYPVLGAYDHNSEPPLPLHLGELFSVYSGGGGCVSIPFLRR